MQNILAFAFTTANAVTTRNSGTAFMEMPPAKVMKMEEGAAGEDVKPAAESNPFEAYMAFLEDREAKIESREIVIDTQIVNIGGKRGDIRRFKTAALSELFPGHWHHDSKIQAIKMNEHTQRMPALHGFVLALHLAFAEDLEFKITPDDIWLLIIQGFSMHINRNADFYRHHFVAHEGKETIEIIRDEFVRDMTQNDWAGCFKDFEKGIRDKIGPSNVALVMNSFTTTTPASVMSMQVVLMDMVKQYLDYKVSTRCGIPKFHIQGTADDWQSMIDRIQKYKEFDLGHWVEHLQSMLQRFLNVANGKDESAWFQSFYKFKSVSGGDKINGHILGFFPYLKSRNEFKLQERFGDYERSFSTDSFPSGITEVPFIWEYQGVNIPMRFRTFSMAVIDDEFEYTISTKPVVQVIEEGAITPAICPQGHELKPFSTFNTHNCDKCHKCSLPANSKIMRCWECDHDICAECISITEEAADEVRVNVGQYYDGMRFGMVIGNSTWQRSGIGVHVKDIQSGGALDKPEIHQLLRSAGGRLFLTGINGKRVRFLEPGYGTRENFDEIVAGLYENQDITIHFRIL